MLVYLKTMFGCVDGAMEGLIQASDTIKWELAKSLLHDVIILLACFMLSVFYSFLLYFQLCLQIPNIGDEGIVELS